MSSNYWDDFERRIAETIEHIRTGSVLKVRRVAVFITNRCNFKCSYCNVCQNPQELSLKRFDEVIQKYGKDAIIHITGGEPSIVSWLYDYIEAHPDVRFHLNSNMYIMPPRNITRLKVSLDSNDRKYFDNIVCKRGAFNKVVANIKEASKYASTSITCTLTKENYEKAPEFMSWCRETFPDLYAVFFSVYKGTDPRFVFSDEDADNFFKNVKPLLEDVMDIESFELLQETIDEKKRIMQAVRFPENSASKPCYISMSERVIDCNGDVWNCSHLFRDCIKQADNSKHKKCLYGCNRRLVAFNEEVEKQIILEKC